MSVQLTQWSKKIATGNKEIDEQHIGLFQTFIDFIAASRGNNTANQLKTTLDFLMQYTQEHLTYEENYYKRCNYPKLKEHRELHSEFKQNLRLIKRTYHNEKGAIEAKKLNEMLGGWLLSHIAVSDMEAAHWIRNNPTKINFINAGLPKED
ncbi:MAG: hemerythrin family protein [Magnetococcales bacterium]|nr:hemerythrin family protein [Magnetococcales bacterium]